RRAEKEIRGRRVLALERLEHSGLLVRVIDADRHQVKRPVAVHAVHGLELRELLETRLAPRRPEIYQENLARGVLAQPLQVLGDGGLYRDRLALDLGDGL